MALGCVPSRVWIASCLWGTHGRGMDFPVLPLVFLFWDPRRLTEISLSEVGWANGEIAEAAPTIVPLCTTTLNVIEALQ